jgi:DNA-binding transcriptional LysR family regulator
MSILFSSRVVLAAHISKFLDRHPEVRLELIMRDHVGDLVADGFDLALRFGEPPGGSGPQNGQERRRARRQSGLVRHGITSLNA